MFLRKRYFPQIHKNVEPSPEQPDNNRRNVDVQQRHISGSQQPNDQRKHVSVHMRSTGVAIDGRVFVGFRRDVLQDLEGALDFHGHHYQQKGKPRFRPTDV